MPEQKHLFATPADFIQQVFSALHVPWYTLQSRSGISLCSRYSFCVVTWASRTPALRSQGRMCALAGTISHFRDVSGRRLLPSFHSLRRPPMMSPSYGVTSLYSLFFLFGGFKVQVCLTPSKWTHCWGVLACPTASSFHRVFICQTCRPRDVSSSVSVAFLGNYFLESRRT